MAKAKKRGDTAAPGSPGPAINEAVEREAAELLRAAPPATAEAPIENETVGQQIRRQHGLIFASYAHGLSFVAVGSMMDPPMDAAIMRQYINQDVELRERMTAAREARAHELIEAAVESAYDLKHAGELKDGADLMIKLAEKIAPKLYGAKASVELTGADGGAIKVEDMTPAEAYRALLGGGKA